MKPFKLDNEPKITSGFTMPDGYFEAFSEKISTKISKEDPRVIPIFRRKKIWCYAAAAVVVMIVSFTVYTNYFSTSEEVDAVALEDYITNQTTISAEEIANLLDQEDLEKMKLELNLGDAEVEEILLNNTDLEQYILD